jgi:hypothetical protein
MHSAQCHIKSALKKKKSPENANLSNSPMAYRTKPFLFLPPKTGLFCLVLVLQQKKSQGNEKCDQKIYMTHKGFTHSR